MAVFVLDRHEKPLMPCSEPQEDGYGYWPNPKPAAEYSRVSSRG